jgi:hypothetical protein
MTGAPAAELINETEKKEMYRPVKHTNKCSKSVTVFLLLFMVYLTVLSVCQATQ